MFLFLLVFVVIDLALIVTSALLGVLIDTPDSLRLHFTAGLCTTISLCFTHLLVMFYLIGTEGDIKEALEDVPDMADVYVSRAKEIKWQVFPIASFAALVSIIAAVLGAEIHSRMLMTAAPDAAPPVRELTVWWLHLVVVIVAVPLNLLAFWVECRGAISNRRTVTEINRELDRREAAESE